MNMLHPVEKAATATTHDHRQEHGGQWYQSSMLESKWMQHAGGRGVWQSELESRIGTDENKLFFKLHTQQAESQQAEYEAQVLYSRMISDFWDIQAGVAYQQEDQTSAQQWRGVVGLHGLAPYFFETEAYLSLAEDQQVQLSLDTERDFLLTQKLILAPYLQAKLVLSDESVQAQKTGLNQLQTGLQMRYEISKKVMPFVDVAYGYHKGLAQTAEQDATESEQGWQYGAGLRLKF
ncbi:copper resistance protein B [Acinetobacter indicus]|uniref:copper resistance protein B n=1 Tax=Acinetobacter indicus TaxID=756892 RepID=UPI0014447234|nr:copper resistance protein B [Acinetobacter indicus]